MIDWLKEFDYDKIMVWVVPGCFIIIFRAFALRGQFPTIKKDDVAAFLVGSTLYNFLLSSVFSANGFDRVKWASEWFLWLSLLVGMPIVVGLALGLFEASDLVGRIFRRLGVSFPSPSPTAWETLFKELEGGSVLIVTLADGSVVYGRWTGGKRLSAASMDPTILDLFVAEIGTLDARDRYVPKTPQRGIYIVASEIRSIEVI